jgi:hypothetical protein
MSLLRLAASGRDDAQVTSATGGGHSAKAERPEVADIPIRPAIRSRSDCGRSAFRCVTGEEGTLRAGHGRCLCPALRSRYGACRGDAAAEHR